MKKTDFYLEKISLFLITFLPIGLLISSGVSETIKFLIIIIFLATNIYKKDFNWVKNKYCLLLLIIWISLLLNLVFSQNFSSSFNRNFFFFTNIIFVFAISLILKKKENFNLILTAYLIITAIVCFDIFIEYFFNKNIFSFQSYDPNRIASFLRQELKIGHFMLAFSFISIGFFFEKYSKKKYQIFGILIIILFFTSLLLTGERANSLRAIFISLIFIIFAKKEIFQFKKIFFIIIILLTLGIYFFSEKIRYRFNVILSPIISTGFIETFKDTQHAAHYYTALKIFENYPIFGVGNKNFRKECLKEEYNDNNYKKISERCSTHPHQIYFELLSEHGLSGTMVIILVFFFILCKSFKIYLKNKNSIHLASLLFIISQFLPFIPSGSFFTSWGATIFWLNFSILIFFNNKNNI